MQGTKYTDRESILRRAQEAIGIPLKDIDTTGRLATGKGAIGTVIEESWFGYTPNSESEPDFPEAGVELKVTPYLRSKAGIRAKERLVCNIINYMEEYKRQTFRDSAFWHKCNTMLLMSYEHLADVPKGEYTIDKAILFSFPEEDLIIIEHDWEVIMGKIRSGNAHMLSEADTLYLAACTKGATAATVREQPFSTIPAKQRAYSLKSSYMTQVLNSYIFGNVPCESIVKDWRILAETTFEQYIERKLAPYYGMTIDQLREHFHVNSTAKNIVDLLLAKMLGVTGKISQTEEFQKAGIQTKTIRLLANGHPKESMSFPAFDFIKLCNESWEDSELYKEFSTTKFLFAVFQSEYTDNPDEMVTNYGVAGKKTRAAPKGVTGFKFKRIVFWNMPVDDLEEVRLVWEKTVSLIKNNAAFTETPQGKRQNNLPKLSESRVAHVRPHAKDSNDTLPLPDGRRMPKQCFWLNAGYVAEQVKER